MKDKGNQKSLIPGMIPGDMDIEFFSDKATKKVYFIQNGRTRVIDKLPQAIKSKIYTMLVNDEVAFQDLQAYKFDQALNEYISCMFGNLNNVPDIINGEVQYAESFTCSPGCRCSKWKSKVTGIAKYGLTEKELEVLEFLIKDKPDKAIAIKLNISPNTVSTHKMSVFKKFNVHSRGELQNMCTHF